MAGSSELADARGMRVLVVVGNPSMRAALERTLWMNGIAVATPRGESAEVAVRRGSYHAVIVDTGSAELSDLDLCRRLREAGHGIPVLLLSDVPLSAHLPGADGYVRKPFSLDDLQACLRALPGIEGPSKTSVRTSQKALRDRMTPSMHGA